MRAGEAGGGGVTFSFTGGVWHGCGGNVLRDVAIDGFGGGGEWEDVGCRHRAVCLG